jgi:hypothetical protein
LLAYCCFVSQHCRTRTASHFDRSHGRSIVPLVFGLLAGRTGWIFAGSQNGYVSTHQAAIDPQRPPAFVPESKLLTSALCTHVRHRAMSTTRAELAHLYKTLPARHRRENAACYLAAYRQPHPQGREGGQAHRPDAGEVGRREEVRRSASGQGLSENGAHRRHPSPCRRFEPGGGCHARPHPCNSVPAMRSPPPVRSW